MSGRIELDAIQLGEISLEANLVATIPPKTLEVFKDPFEKAPPVVDDEGNEVSLKEASITGSDKAKNYVLGKNRPRDTDGGDAGSILQKTMYWPQVNFVRSLYNGKPRNNFLHQDVSTGSNNKQMKQFMITSAICVTYQGLFEVDMFQLQNASSDNCPGDYGSDYTGRIIQQRKLMQKNAGKDTSLAAIIRNLAAQGAESATGSPAGTPNPEKDTDHQAISHGHLNKRIDKMRKIVNF